MTSANDKCPECGGTGLHDPDNGGPPDWTSTMQLIDCPACNGTGRRPREGEPKVQPWENVT